MTLLLRILKFVVILIILLLVVAFFLPSTSEVSRQIEINRSADKVYGYVNDLRQFNRWSPWRGIDPEAKYQFEGPESGVGSIVRWSSEHREVGKGMQEIVAAEPNKSVETSLSFDGQGDAVARWLLDAAGENTTVTWEFETDWGYNPIGRYMGLMMDKWVGGSYETGLENLKSLVEKET